MSVECTPSQITGEWDANEKAEKDHDPKLVKLFEECKAEGIKLNKNKFKPKINTVPYMGHILSDEGIKPNPMKVIWKDLKMCTLSVAL